MLYIDRIMFVDTLVSGTPHHQTSLVDKKVSIGVLSCLQEFMPLPPDEVENGENSASEEPKLQFSYVECLLFGFHQLGKKLPDFLLEKVDAECLKDFKIR